MKSFRTWLPHRIRGKHNIITDGWQVVGGKRWSLVLFANINVRKGNDA